ncbi:uncharacterized protein LOC127002594 [Eriocheir sinensis]|uniref:uncharacterized protein LOC127002594 n=1 Tax=Eriocheir sinensis TaxID=95602 RepID=UPI0021C9715B|nr:uncharacterized protein LOC127002594 [Eriocheir sinensis]
MSKKWKSLYDSSRKFKDEWEIFFLWVKQSSDGSGEAFCKLCHCNLVPRLSSLQNHEKSDKHQKRQAAIPYTSALKVSPNVSDEVKRAELEIATAICCHCSTISVDHISDIIKRNGKGSTLGKINIHRTKCSKILTEVISPAYVEELKSDVLGQKFAILVDESTDVASKKLLCVVIRYFSRSEKKIVTELVELVEVSEATREALFQAIKNSIEKLGLSLKDCIGYASDGASVMTGTHNSVWSRIHEESPNCVQMKCICHSLALCVQAAFKKLPASLGFLLAEIPKWFSKSAIRREAFSTLFSIMDPCEERKGTPLPFQQASVTRWLVRGKVMNNILFNWEELKAYFMCAEKQSTPDCMYKARVLHGMLNDHINFLYMHCLTPLIAEFERVNAYFQLTDADPQSLEEELRCHYQSLCARVKNYQGEILPVEEVDFGAKFAQEVQRHLEKYPESEERIQEVKVRCLAFINEAIQQLERRLPPTQNTFKSLSALNPVKILSQFERVKFKDLPFPHLVANNFVKIEEQYRKILHVDCSEEPVFSGKIPENSTDFWSRVLRSRAKAVTSETAFGTAIPL